MQFCLDLVQRTAILTIMIAAGLPAETIPQAGSDSAAAPQVVSVVRPDPKTGRLVRTFRVSGKPARTPGVIDVNIRSLVERTATELHVNPLLVDSLIQVESNYDPFAISSKGAQGLMQLMPETARRFGVTNSFDLKQNIEGGVRYLRFLEDTFQDDRLAVAAYNAGEKAVAKYGDVPPYPETVSYVAKVGKKYGQAKRAAVNQASKAEEPVPAAEQADEAPKHILAYVDPEGKLHL